NEEVRRMMTKPCPVCGADAHYFGCHGVEEWRIIGDKMCPIHAASIVKNCLMVDPGSHMAL
ncbi:MAG: hypothetical protein AAB968_01870, partial [Patescibacteria group bacterium]